MTGQVIGKVTASEKAPTSCGTVRFWVDEAVMVRPFDVVRIRHLQDSYSYAMIKDLQYISDSAGHLASFVSSDFGDVNIEPHNVRMGTTVAEAEILYNTHDIEMPVKDGMVVEWADVDGIQEALGLRASGSPIPAGYIRNSQGTEVPVELEGRYLLGPEGAHLNIAGISGLATKTTYAMFLLNAIQQRLEDKATMILFNVKGKDLLSIDEPSKPALTAEQSEEWVKCGLVPRPFERVTYLYPFADRPGHGYSQSYVDGDRLARQQGAGQAFNYFYDVETGKERLGLLFADIDDPQDTLSGIVASQQVLGSDASSWKAFRTSISGRTQKGAQGADQIQIQSWRKFYRLLRSRTENDVFTERRCVGSEEMQQVLIRDALLALKPGDVLVIDIASLPGYLQSFVFGDVVETLYESILEGDEGMEEVKKGTVAIFADELNKYAPKFSGQGKALTNNLLEITERGRSIGVVLFGAEQFRSGVHDRILGNCSTNVYGRTSPVEIEKCADYKYIPKTHKWALQRLNQGELFLQHVVFRAPLVKVRFPMPAYYQPKTR